jgi:hypothetical protein
MKRECSQCEAAARADIAHICDHVMEAMRIRARALTVFGEAIAMVAQAQLMSATCRGLQINDRRKKRAALYFAECGLWLVYRASSLEPQEIESPHPADRAAEVIAMMIEEQD